MYKISLSDNSFIIADENYKLTLFNSIFKRTITVKQYLAFKDKHKNYKLTDLIDNKKIDRPFTIEETDLDFPVGSRIKYAIDIQIGDIIQGPNGEPRKVDELHTGEDDMYEIAVNGKTYTVNGGHILALVDKTTGEHLEVPVNIYMHMNDEFRSHYLMEVEQLTNIETKQ